MFFVGTLMYSLQIITKDLVSEITGIKTAEVQPQNHNQLLIKINCKTIKNCTENGNFIKKCLFYFCFYMQEKCLEQFIKILEVL